MGRRRAVDAVVSGADSSESSAESSFRELDDVFLQTQTRIWLGEVLKTRLNEEIHISDLLADGELLFQVSKLVWNMLLVKCVELKNLKAYQHPLRSRRSSGRYMPYSNVDSFLKICKVLGLNGIDLFSPSDVVEKRDTRKVCICIRALSKKARSKQLNVPDFDVVTYALAMPTEMVECIRRSLESSHCSFSSSSGYNSLKDIRSKIQQKSSISECDGNYDSASDVSDEAESKYYGDETYCSFENKFDNPATLDLEISSGAFSAVKLNTTKKRVLQPELGKPYISEFEDSNSKLPSALESASFFSMHDSGNCNDSDNKPSCHTKSQVHLHNRNSSVNNDTSHHYGSTSELSEVDLGLCNDDSSVRDSLYDTIAERDFISDYLAFSDSVVFGTDGNSPVIFDGEDNMCNFFMGIDSYISSSNRKNRYFQKSPDDMEDVEVSSTASMSSILGRVLNMDFDEQFDVGDSSIMKVEPIAYPENEAHNQNRSLFVKDQIRELAHFETLSYGSATDTKESQNEMKLGNLGLLIDRLSSCHYQGPPCTVGSQIHEEDGGSQIHPDKYKLREQRQSGPSAISSVDISKASHQEFIGHNEQIVDYIEHAIEDHRKHNTLDSLAENALDGRNHPSSEVQKDKRRKRPLLKTFVGGTALVGVLFLLLHISRRGQEGTDVPCEKLNPAQKFKGAKSSSQKEQSCRRNGTYPAEKLKFGK